MGFMMVFWLLLIGFVVFLFLQNIDKRPSQGPGGEIESPLDILQKRYARGEITHEQFEEMKKHLQP